MIAKTHPPPPTPSLPIRSASKPLSLPLPAFGTFSFGPPDWVYPSVLAALRSGYRHIDSAWMYGADAPIGAAIRDAGVAREEVWVTSKVPPHMMAPGKVEGCVQGIIERMGVGYLDLCLIHWPVAWRMGEGVEPVEMLEGIMAGVRPEMEWEFTSGTASEGRGSILATWRALQECVRKGLVRAVGVSNFSCREMREILPYQGDVPLSVVQVELHPWFPQRELVEFARENGIVVEAYTIFGGNGFVRELLIQNPEVQKLAEENGLDVGQMIVSWAVSKGIVPVTKSRTPSRIKTNLDIVHLPQRIIDVLDSLEEPNGKGRTSDPSEAWGVRLFREDRLP